MVVFTFSVLDLFLQILFKKINLGFWCYSHLFSRKELMPVAFLVINNFENIFKKFPFGNLLEVVPSFFVQVY